MNRMVVYSSVNEANITFLGGWGEGGGKGGGGEGRARDIDTTATSFFKEEYIHVNITCAL